MTEPNWSEPSAVPTDEQVDAATALAGARPDVTVKEPLDFVSAESVDVVVSADLSRIWVSVDGVTMLRAQRMSRISVQLPPAMVLTSADEVPQYDPSDLSPAAYQESPWLHEGPSFNDRDGED